MAERAGVVAGLKVAAFIRWAFSEGTNDRGGRRRKDTAARRSRRSSRRSRTCRERGRRKRTFCLTLSKSFSHPDNDFARSLARSTVVENENPGLCKRLERGPSPRCKVSPKPAIKEIKTPKERAKESHLLHRRVRRTWDWKAYN